MICFLSVYLLINFYVKNPLAGIPNAPTLPSGLFENDFIQLLAKVLRFT